MRSDHQIIEGSFVSPLALYMPSLITPDIRTAYFQLILPRKWSSENFKPVCIHLAGTGDHVSSKITIFFKNTVRQHVFHVVLLEKKEYYG